MIRKGQVLHREGVTGRWQVRHCQKNETEKHQEGPKPNHHVPRWSPVRLLSRTAAWWDFLDFVPRNTGSNDAVLLLKINPSMSKEDPAWRLWWWWDPVSALSLELFRCDAPPAPSRNWGRLSDCLLPVWTCSWMTTSFLPTCVFSFDDTWWQWQIEDENAHLYGVAVWSDDRGKQDNAMW